ncbi:unnamed protein product [Moneuplotes crassus]|uniref:4-nitrophenylphosphatase n=1 Tax=Euplotes crassus TaxID=5936 RepID=A0AAD2D2N4_EUPCR|nr:unnamed protein product [Moneuplotes crassus]
MEGTETYFEDLVEKYNHFMIDCDGVLLSGTKAIEGSVEAVNRLIEQKKSCYFITNSSGRTSKGLREKLDKFGISLPETGEATYCCFSSSYTTSLYIKQEYPEIKKVFVLGEKGLCDQLEEEGIQTVGLDITEISIEPEEYENYELDEDIQAVVVGYDQNINYRKLSIASLYLQNGRKFIACNPDMFDSIHGRPIPTTGVTIEALTYITGLKPYICGKPNPHIVNIIDKEFGLPEEEKAKTVMIGDRLTTDIYLAHNAGVDSCLVLTGCNTAEDVHNKEENPDKIIPTHVMPRLGHFRESA